MPRSKTATDCDVFAVISLAIKRPVQPPPMMATSTGLRFVMAAASLPCSANVIEAIQIILPLPADVVEVHQKRRVSTRCKIPEAYAATFVSYIHSVRLEHAGADAAVHAPHRA